MTTRIPGVSYADAPKGYGPGLAGPRYITVHDTGNTASAADEAHYAANRTDPRIDWTSAHAYVDAGTVIGSVPLDEQAWAAYVHANSTSLHVEMCGQNAGAPGAVPAATIERTARLVAELADMFDIPKVYIGAAGIAAGAAGIVGHLDWTTEEHRAGGHDDPGARFDWPAFIHAVNNNGTPPTPPVPVGLAETEQLMNTLPVLKQDVGHADGWVRNLQALTHAWNLVDADGLLLTIDGSFGPKTDFVVRGFQVSHEVKNSVVQPHDESGAPTGPAHGDGIVGLHTWAALLRVE